MGVRMLFQYFFSGQARGVAILFNNNFEFKVLKTVRDESSNRLIFEVIIEGKRLTLINIYGQNRKDLEFYEEITNNVNVSENPTIELKILIWFWIQIGL